MSGRRFYIGVRKTSWREQGQTVVEWVGAHCIDLDWPIFRNEPP
jgi:hypothetical protein